MLEKSRIEFMISFVELIRLKGMSKEDQSKPGFSFVSFVTS